MRILVSNIRAVHVLQEQVELNPQVLLGEPPDFVRFDQPVNVSVQAQMTTTNIVVTGHASTQAVFNCARCLTDFTTAIKGNFQDVFSLDHESIDLSEMIRETVLVDIPLRGICKESCRGLCSHCGANLNADACACQQGGDERWAALQQFRFKQ
jgi:uncharacterized protein